MKASKNNFFIILGLSIVTFVAILFLGFSLYKDKSSTFDSEGYIISSTNVANNKYFFKGNTKYKENVDKNIMFNDSNSKSVIVDEKSFIHYLNGNISFLTKGALVNLEDLDNDMINYYNVNDNNIMKYSNNGYNVSINGKDVLISSFISRISDNKYLVAGKNLELKLPQVENKISADFFEIVYIENGIVNIDSKEAGYQVTAQDSYVYIGDNMYISLGDGRIFLNNVPKMLMGQITINGNENIDLDANKKDLEASEGSGNGDGSGDGSSDGEGDGEETGTGENGDASNGDGDKGTGEGSNGGNASTGVSTTETPIIELISVNNTSTSLELSLQLNNSSLAKGQLIYHLTSVYDGNIVDAGNIEMKDGTFKIMKESLSPSTEYVLTIGELNSENGRQYFQKIFKTDDLGVSLEKLYATDSKLVYKVNFDETSSATKVGVKIYDSDGTTTDIDPYIIYIDSSSIDTTFEFKGLKSNSNYSVMVEDVWINNTTYTSVYSINRIDKTLKKTPVLSGVNVSSNADELKFTIDLKSKTDKDEAIINYVYKIYNANDVTSVNKDPKVIYSVTKSDIDPLVLDLNKIPELKAGVDYRAKIVAEYFDNEMIREVSSDFSGNFLIKSKPNISLTVDTVTMNKMIGTISLTDANCSIPFEGRSCNSKRNNLIIRYYNLKDGETENVEQSIVFDSRTLKSNIELSGLASNSTYALKMFGNYIDDNGILHENIQIGETVFFKTDKSDKLEFEVISDNKSGFEKDGKTPNSNNVVTFDARLSAPQDSTIKEEIKTITFNMYSGKYSTDSTKLIGKYIVNDPKDIENLFNNVTILNSLFDDVTKNNLGKLNSLNKMKTVTNNLLGTLNRSYTIEITDVLDSAKNSIEIINNVYTFNLTDSYYLDATIEIYKKDTFVTVNTIKKENLDESQEKKLASELENFDELNKDTVVGIIIENSLDGDYIYNAYNYEKVVVNYIIKRKSIETGEEKVIKKIDVDMGNKYQPKEILVFLDDISLDDGKHFTRGYDYTIGYTLSFSMQDGSNPVYNNSALNKQISIDRQSPIYTWYISNSNDKELEFLYSMKDVDNALANKNFTYKVGKGVTNTLNDSIVADGEYHTVVIQVDEKDDVSLMYDRKKTNGSVENVTISTYGFEGVYKYDKSISYRISKEKTNSVRINLENNEYTSRAAVYKVTISSNDESYVRYYLASKLNVDYIDTGILDENDEPILTSFKYIDIDYANISNFMGSTLKINVDAFYDSGLVGVNQDFSDGLILVKKTVNKKSGKEEITYLNTYNELKNPPDKEIPMNNMSYEEDSINGLYFLNSKFNSNDKIFNIYNRLYNIYPFNAATKKYEFSYKTKEGADVLVSPIADNVATKYSVSATNAGMLLTKDNKDYSGYNIKALSAANLVTDDNLYKFDAIVPLVKVSSSKTINSFTVSMTTSGIYGGNQFNKDKVVHNYLYVTVYSDKECKDEVKTLSTPISIYKTSSGYGSSVQDIEFTDLKPDTSYYYKIFAYIDNVYTWLYDADLSKLIYTSKVYDVKTYSGEELFSKIIFTVKPSSYYQEVPTKTLNWTLGLKNKKNYKIRFELYKKDGKEVNADGEEIVKYKQVMFDGRDAVSCSYDDYGTSSSGYNKNCYISLAKNDVSGSSSLLVGAYKFNNRDFVFGDDYYKLIVYAIPYTNGKYSEEDKQILYQNDSLSKKNTENEIIDIPFLNEAVLEVGEYSSSCELNKGCNIELVTKITDVNFAMSYGKYNVMLTDENDELVDMKEGLLVTVDSNNKIIPDKILFNNLKSGQLYNVYFSYNTFRNNINFTPEEKVKTSTYSDFMYTSVSGNISLGGVTANRVNTKSINLAYNGAAGLSDITEIEYTISMKGGTSKATGLYKVNKNHSFTYTSDGVMWFNINVGDETVSSNPSFTFANGNVYTITLKYKYNVRDKKGEYIYVLDESKVDKNTYDKNKDIVYYYNPLDKSYYLDIDYKNKAQISATTLKIKNEYLEDTSTGKQSYTVLLNVN